MRQPEHSRPTSVQWASSQFGGRQVEASIVQLRPWVSSGSLMPPQPICRPRWFCLAAEGSALASNFGASAAAGDGTRATRRLTEKGVIRGETGAKEALGSATHAEEFRRREFRRAQRWQVARTASFSPKSSQNHISR